MGASPLWFNSCYHKNVTNQDINIRLEQAKTKWQLKIGHKLGGGFRSEVFDCTTPDNNPVILKLMPTPEQAEIEATALKIWAATDVAVKLIDADLDNATLLLERVQPAMPLPSTDETTAVAIAADILKVLHAAPLLHANLPTLEDTYGHLEQRALEDARYEQEHQGESDRGKPALTRLSAARELVRRLCSSTDRKALLHGDFITKNLLLKGSSYVAIDPMPMIGDPCSDIGFFAAAYPSPDNMLKRAETIAMRMGESASRAQQWSVIWAILQAVQAWRDDQRGLEQFVRSERAAQFLRT
jgi:streptomycin 6-kinase